MMSKTPTALMGLTHHWSSKFLVQGHFDRKEITLTA